MINKRKQIGVAIFSMAMMFVVSSSTLGGGGDANSDKYKNSTTEKYHGLKNNCQKHTKEKICKENGVKNKDVCDAYYNKLVREANRKK